MIMPCACGRAARVPTRNAFAICVPCDELNKRLVLVLAAVVRPTNPGIADFLATMCARTDLGTYRPWARRAEAVA